MKFRRQPLGLIRPKTKTKPSSEQPIACNQTHYFHECVDSCYYPLARNTVFAQTYFPGGDQLDSNLLCLRMRGDRPGWAGARCLVPGSVRWIRQLPNRKARCVSWRIFTRNTVIIALEVRLRYGWALVTACCRRHCTTLGLVVGLPCRRLVISTTGQAKWQKSFTTRSRSSGGLP
jgi:hypothetical protein